jgi:hypothetical protein
MHAWCSTALREAADAIIRLAFCRNMSLTSSPPVGVHEVVSAIGEGGRAVARGALDSERRRGLAAAEDATW